VKLVAVLAALTACLVLAFKQGPQAAKTLVIMTLLLIVTNAAFRSLYPLSTQLGRYLGRVGHAVECLTIVGSPLDNCPDMENQAMMLH